MFKLKQDRSSNLYVTLRRPATRWKDLMTMGMRMSSTFMPRSMARVDAANTNQTRGQGFNFTLAPVCLHPQWQRSRHMFCFFPGHFRLFKAYGRQIRNPRETLYNPFQKSVKSQLFCFVFDRPHRRSAIEGSFASVAKPPMNTNR